MFFNHHCKFLFSEEPVALFMKFCVYDSIENNGEVMNVHGVACIMLKLDCYVLLVCHAVLVMVQ